MKGEGPEWDGFLSALMSEEVQLNVLPKAMSSVQPSVISPVRWC